MKHMFLLLIRGLIVFFILMHPNLAQNSLYAQPKNINLEQVITALAKQLKSSHVASRKYAIMHLSKIKNNRVTPYLKEGLNDSHRFIRILSAKALQNHHKSHVVSALIRRLKIENDMFVQKAIIESLSQLKDKRSIWILNQLKPKSNLLIKKTIEKALIKLEKADSSKSFYLNFFKSLE